MAATVDEAKLEQFMGQMVGHMTGGGVVLRDLARRRARPLPGARRSAGR